MAVFNQKSSEMKQPDVCVHVTLKCWNCYRSIWSTQSSSGESKCREGFYVHKVKPTKHTKCYGHPSMRKAYKNDFQVKELFLETAKLYPWFCWQAEKFLWLSKHYERQSEFALRHTYNCWLRIMKIGRTCTKFISRDKIPFKRNHPRYFDTSRNIFRTIVLPTTHL